MKQDERLTLLGDGDDYVVRREAVARLAGGLALGAGTVAALGGQILLRLRAIGRVAHLVGAIGGGGAVLDRGTSGRRLCSHRSSFPLALGGLQLAPHHLVEVVKNLVATLPALPGVVLQVEDRWVASARLLEEVLGPLHGFRLDVGNVDGLPLLPVHDITDDALRLPRGLIAPVGLGRIRLGSRPPL